jgi:hypothetical protein
MDVIITKNIFLPAAGALTSKSSAQLTFFQLLHLMNS